MDAKYDYYGPVKRLQAGMAAVRDGIAAAAPKTDPRPFFVEHEDGSVTTRAGVQVRPPRETKPTDNARP